MSPWPPSTNAWVSSTRHAELLGDERPEPGRVEHAGHAEDALAREAGGRHRHVAHRVERVRDDDEDRVRRRAPPPTHDGTDDPGVLGQQVVAAHPRLPGEAGRDDDDVAARGVGIVVRAEDPGVVAHDRGRLGEIETLALRQALDDVDQDDVREAGLGDPLGGGRADVPGADDGDLVAGHGRVGPPWGTGVDRDRFAGGRGVAGILRIGRASPADVVASRARRTAMVAATTGLTMRPITRFDLKELRCRDVIRPS